MMGTPNPQEIEHHTTPHAVPPNEKDMAL